MIPGLRTSLKLVLVGMAVAIALTATPILHLTPGGSLFGTPGSTVGWGFGLTNDVNWIEVVQAQFCLDSVVSNPCFIASTQFTDIISNFPNDVIVGPSGSASQPYNPGANMGLGSFAVAPGAAIGSSVVGHILLTYNTFDADPNAGGNQIGFNDAISTPASVTAVPEPVGFLLAGFALAGFGTLRFQRRRLKPMKFRTSPCPTLRD